MRDITDKYGRIVGRIMESDNNTQRAYDRTGVYVGTYNENADATLDRNGRYVGRGNSLASLIFESDD